MHPCIHASLRSRFALIFLVFALISPHWVNAQVESICEVQADFNVNIPRCEAFFSPLYSGPGTVISHKWEFYESTTATTASTSNLANPVNTFLGDGQTKRVKHTIWILDAEGNIKKYECRRYHRK